MLACASHLVGGLKFIYNPYFIPYIRGYSTYIYIYNYKYIAIYIYGGITDLLSRAHTPKWGKCWQKIQQQTDIKIV